MLCCLHLTSIICLIINDCASMITIDHIQELEDDQRYWSKELQYLNDYIHYKGLDDDYQYFRQNAHEERDENLPFAFYTL